MKNILLNFLFVVVLIAVSGCSEAGNIEAELAGCKTSSEPFYDTCCAQVALKFSSAEVCNSIGNWAVRDGCIISVALAKQDILLCDSVSDQTKKTTLQDKMCKAMISGNPEYCDEITSFIGAAGSATRGTCYAFLVEKQKNASLCDRLEKSSAKNYCVLVAANVTGDIKPCNTLWDGSAKGRCYAVVVEKKKDPKLCEGLKTNDAKGHCYLAAINVLGLVEDVEWCSILPSRYDKDECFTSYATSTGEWQYCENVLAESGKWACYSEAAIKAKNADVCEKSYGDLRDKCLIAVAESTQDLSVCSRLSESYLRYVPVSDLGYCSKFFMDVS